MLLALAANQLRRIPRDITDQYGLTPLGTEYQMIQNEVNTKPVLSPRAEAQGLAAGYTGQRWDFDFSLSENAHLFIGPDAPDWNHYRREFFREGIKGMQARGISPSALEGFLIPYRALAQSDPEKLYGWTSEVGDLGGLFMGPRPLGPALIEAARANRQAMREALEDLGLE